MMDMDREYSQVAKDFARRLILSATLASADLGFYPTGQLNPQSPSLCLIFRLLPCYLHYSTTPLLPSFAYYSHCPSTCRFMYMSPSFRYPLPDHTSLSP